MEEVIRRKISEIIFKSVNEYNDTLSREHVRKSSHDEKRGILYNTLKRNISYEYPSATRGFSDYLDIRNLFCTFHPNNCIKTIRLDTRYSYKDVDFVTFDMPDERFGKLKAIISIIKQVCNNTKEFGKGKEENDIIQIVNSIN
jgi:hypothetical protein